MGDPPALPCSCSCSPAAPGSAAAVHWAPGGPQNPGALSPLLVMLRSPQGDHQFLLGSPRDPQIPSDALESPALLGILKSPAMFSFL